MPGFDPDHDEAVVAESKARLKAPPMFRVLLHNDDYTSMEFVVFILRDVFQLPEADAFRIMLQVHNQGVGIAGVFTYEVAEAKVARVISLAQENEFPLLASMEEE